MQGYINIHTHHSDNGLALVNKYEHFDQVPEQSYCSMGLHPWYLGDVVTKMMDLKKYSTSPKVLAIGECGLDALCDMPMPVQEDAFRQQIKWANDIGKPLIIHCVRAYDKVLALLKEARVPAIFHGFNKKMALAEKVLEQGHYLSFGAALLSRQASITEVIAMVPEDRFFLETDAAAVSIADVYQTTALIRKTEVDTLILQLQQNFKTVFGI